MPLFKRKFDWLADKLESPSVLLKLVRRQAAHDLAVPVMSHSSRPAAAASRRRVLREYFIGARKDELGHGDEPALSPPTKFDTD